MGLWSMLGGLAALLLTPRSELAWAHRAPEPLCTSRDTRPSCSRPLPSVGAIYAGAMRFPVIGHQHFRLHIASKHSARIQLTGPLLNMDDTAECARRSEWEPPTGAWPCPP